MDGTLVLITGASRGLGLEALKAALRAGYSVRALPRSAYTIPLNDARLKKICGDALDEGAVSQSLNGVDAVIQTLGVPITAGNGAQGNKIVLQCIAAARQADAGRRRATAHHSCGC